VVQESLTNALKHGTGTAQLVRDYSETAVVLEIRNPVRGEAPTSVGGGHGLVGMRERVTALGGRFTAGAEPDGWFTVRAEIPREDRA
jgi:signal transduction histidine kinase